MAATVHRTSLNGYPVRSTNEPHLHTHIYNGNPSAYSTLWHGPATPERDDDRR